MDDVPGNLLHHRQRSGPDAAPQQNPAQVQNQVLAVVGSWNPERRSTVRKRIPKGLQRNTSTNLKSVAGFSIQDPTSYYKIYKNVKEKKMLL